MGFNDPDAAKLKANTRGILGASMPSRRPGDPRQYRSAAPLLNDRMLGEGLYMTSDGKIAVDWDVVAPRSDARPERTVYFHAHFDVAGVDTTPPATLRFLDNSLRHSIPIDLTDYRQVMFFLNQRAVGAAGSFMELYWTAPYSNTLGDYLPIGSSPARLSTATSGVVLDTDWVDIVPAARQKVYLAILTDDGDGATSPQYGVLGAHFRR